jgi:pyruvate dehydrogenase E2 component (dihydrolipoamide acetyltransferase)
VTVEVDVEKIEALRTFFKEEESGKVSINDFVVKACAMALVEMPEVNATFQGDHVLQYGSVHIGVAAAVDDGLLVPVIKNAHAMTLRQLADASRSLVEKARAGKLHPDEMSGSTFSISNMGMLNVDDFSAIINQPNAAIVAIATAKRKVVPVSDEEVEIRMMMNVTGSFDHRVVDGAIGAKFMNVVRDYLENPTRLLS